MNANALAPGTKLVLLIAGVTVFVLSVTMPATFIVSIAAGPAWAKITDTFLGFFSPVHYAAPFIFGNMQYFQAEAEKCVYKRNTFCGSL